MAVGKLHQLWQAMFLPPYNYEPPIREDLDRWYRPWGFTIYRTSYEPKDISDMQWEALVNKIKMQATAEIDGYGEEEEDKSIVARIKELFFLDLQSDPVLLGGKSMPEVRVHHLLRPRAELAANPRGDFQDTPPTWPGPNLFLLADADVLEGVSEDPYYWIKCIEARHDERTERETRPGTGETHRGITMDGCA